MFLASQELVQQLILSVAQSWQFKKIVSIVSIVFKPHQGSLAAKALARAFCRFSSAPRRTWRDRPFGSIRRQRRRFRRPSACPHT